MKSVKWILGLIVLSMLCGSQAVPAVQSGVEAALSAAVAGPGMPKGTKINSVDVLGEEVIIDLSEDVVADGLNDAQLEAIFEQFRGALEPYGLNGTVRVLANGFPLHTFLPPVKDPGIG